MDIKQIREYVLTGHPHPCNSCYSCLPNYKSVEDKEKCELRNANQDKVSRKVIAYKTIEDYISKNDYTYTVEEIITSYEKYYLKGYYVSFTTKDCIEKLEESIKVLLS